MPRKRKLFAVRNEIESLYRTGEWTYRKLGERYGVTYGTMHNMMKAWLTKEERSEIQRTLMKARMYPESSGRLAAFESEIVSSYREGGVSQRQLADKYRCSKRVIQTILGRAKIPVDDRRRIARRNTYKDVRHWKYGGGKRITTDGHIQVRVNGKYISEHRLIAAMALNRELAPSEIVHHMDGNQQNNSQGNLMVLPSNGLHSELHHWIYRQIAKTHMDAIKELHVQFSKEFGGEVLFDPEPH